MTKNYTTAQVAKLIDRSLSHTQWLIRKKLIKAHKLDDTVKNSPYMITDIEIKSYLQQYEVQNDN